MKKIYYLTLIILIFGLFISPSFVIGENNNYKYINSEIKELNKEIEDKKNRSKQIEKKQKEYSQKIQNTQSKKATLNNQISILENRLTKVELEIEKVEIDIDRTQLEVQKTDLEIEEKGKEIENEKRHIGDVLKTMYEKDQVTTLEIMLLNNSLSDFLSQAKYLENVSESLDESLESLGELKTQLENEKEILGEKEDELIALKNNLADKRKELGVEQDSKTSILDQVKSNEVLYQDLLAKAKAEQSQASNDISYLEKQVRAKLALLSNKDKEKLSNSTINWPVPKNLITAYFHDPSYPFRYIFEHPAVDVRAAQGTTLKSAANGYVARIKNGGRTGYSYIMIIHGNGLSTVYGHVSKIYVQEDDYVTQGQTIGATGGMPGTSGAGSLSSGPHLHFEVRLNGIPVDPLGYLP
jgi:murein DD-endopeptidase MepM/ murein hydrolase activator NlpD